MSKADIRLVILTGPPGIGKTRLSIETARAVLGGFPDGVLFVAFAPLDDPALIGITSARALGYVGVRNISALEQIIGGIADKQVLLLLDNCEHLIEEVAARTRFLSPAALLERLDDQFVLSAGGGRAVAPRQKTLLDATRWSYNLLTAQEQKLFSYLSVVSGGFSNEAAERVFPRTLGDAAVSELVVSLFDKSLVQRTFDPRGEARFEMLLTIRQFALNQLRSLGNAADARNGHLAFCIGLAAAGNPEIRGPHQVEWLNWLNAQHDNLHAALDWAIRMRQTESALQLVRKLH